MSGKYDDLLGLDRPVSPRHPPMPLAERAAQFLPFAALTGFGDALHETARLTDRRIEPAEDEKAALGARLNELAARLPQETGVTLTYFLPDPYKEGGSYITLSGTVKKLDEAERVLVLCGGTRIPLDDLTELELL